MFFPETAKEQKLSHQINMSASYVCLRLWQQVRTANNFYASFQELLFMFVNVVPLERTQLLPLKL